MRKLALILLFTLLPPKAHALETEARLKTAFIYQFTKYVDWPMDSLTDNFTLVVVGPTDLKPHLEELSREKKIKDRPINIVQVQHPEEIPTGQLVFLPGDNLNAMESVVSRIQGKPTLLITEGSGFAARGSVLNFVTTPEGKLRFEANRKAAEKQKLVLSSQLLKMARLVGE